MFNFKKSVTSPATTQPTVAAVSKKYPEKVHEIHNTFMNAGEKLLADAKSIIANAEIKDEEKIKRLKRIGFGQANQVREAEEKIQKRRKAESDAKIVEYYAIKYPQYKFITEEIVKAICEKYNLVFGVIGQYKGFVPEKNLADIESFRVRDEDCIEKQDYVSISWIAEQMMRAPSFDLLRDRPQSYIDYYRQETLMRQEIDTPKGLFGLQYKQQEEKKSSPKSYVREFKICAPEKDMDARGYRKEGHKLIPDPVVLHPVKNGYLIVTAWGDEASDENVINQKMN